MNKGIVFSPFVKWVGGKRKIISSYLKKYIPSEFNTYIEPFVGGGAMFCFLQAKKSIINDINTELITTYKVLKENYKELCSKLDEFSKSHSFEFFSKMRSINLDELSDIEIAARFIYLNKTCFNGLYRVNRNGKFNTPMDRNKTSVNLYNKENLSNWSNFLTLSDTTILNENYLDVLDKCKKNDFVYCDPPYDYENKNGFVSYSKDGFNKEDQIELAKKLKQLHEKGVKWMLSNHDTKLINELYKDFKIIRFKANRMINSNPNERINSAQEVIVMNYEFDFDYYLNTLKDKNVELYTLVDFDKIQKNIKKIEKPLMELNYLICDSKDEFKNKLNELFKKDKSIFKCIPILVAIREDDKQKFRLNDNNFYPIDEIIEDPEKLFNFFDSSKILEMVINKKIKNFLDYAFGIEVGLDTHTRKNRNGSSIEKSTYQLLKDLLLEFGDKVKISEQVTITDFSIENKNKKFDLVIELFNNKKILIESSFYNAQGSKISETARAYRSLNDKINTEDSNNTFIWLADGQGMKSVAKNLKSDFEKGYIYNHQMFFDSIIDIIKEKMK